MLAAVALWFLADIPLGIFAAAIGGGGLGTVILRTLASACLGALILSTLVGRFGRLELIEEST
jgi:ABC-type proline/glycine betaine transport system permease subunit